jgi:methionine synthase II (cobalamin-independent)
MFEPTIAGSLPKPAWLAQTHKLWPQWKAQGAELAEAKRDATLVWIKSQEDAGLDIVTDGVDVVQFDERAFNVYMKDVNAWGPEALERAAVQPVPAWARALAAM